MRHESTLQQTKDRFRKESLQRLRDVARSKNAYIKDKEIMSKLSLYIKSQNIRVVMVYLPLAIEYDITQLIVQLRKSKKRVLVPFMEKTSFRLVQYRLPLQKNKFGIREPKISKQFTKKQIDLAIVPIVGTDFTLRRVGFGKGMYDRFFSKNRHSIRTTVFVARQLCYSQVLATNSHDISADVICVPKVSIPKNLRYKSKFL
ncbi:MAG TPA: 5-formyltetrahydrofolate cyclo-ligase [Epsilonproteobacteria bacterium]|nr:5-formyltetrahydrofolate cyclo-ligase [Campylobacterota bacterium]